MSKIEKQKTIACDVVFHGVGVHSGLPSCITLKPSSPNSGIQLINSKDHKQVMHIGKVVPISAMHATVLQTGTWQVSTIEHVMAAIGLLGIDNVSIEVEGDEFPILDGSSFPFVQSLLEVGITEQESEKRYLTPREELIFKDEHGRSIIIKPAKLSDTGYDKQLHLTYKADFEHPLVGACHFDCTITKELFINEIAPARTFGFLAHLPLLRKLGLSQGSTLGNTVLVGD